MAENNQILEPVEQDVIPFHDHEIIAVKLADERICVVLRWVCETLQLDPQGQVQRIERTAAIENELVRVRVKPRIPGSKGGGVQTMPALTLRGFPTWILGINPNEVEEDPEHPEQAEHIRQMIIAYQVEAVDVLYRHFSHKLHPAVPEPPAITHQPLAKTGSKVATLQPIIEPGPDASHEEQATYHENMSLWHRWQADFHLQEWRKSIQQQQVAVAEEEKAMGNLLASVQKQMGPEKITNEHQTLVQLYVHTWSHETKKNRGIIYNDLHLTFRVPRYQEIPEAEWPQVEAFFRKRMPSGVLPIAQQSFDFDELEG